MLTCIYDAYFSDRFFGQSNEAVGDWDATWNWKAIVWWCWCLVCSSTEICKLILLLWWTVSSLSFLSTSCGQIVKQLQYTYQQQVWWKRVVIVVLWLLWMLNLLFWWWSSIFHVTVWDISQQTRNRGVDGFFEIAHWSIGGSHGSRRCCKPCGVFQKHSEGPTSQSFWEWQSVAQASEWGKIHHSPSCRWNCTLVFLVPSWKCWFDCVSHIET